MGAQFLALGVSLPLLLVGVWLLKSGWWPSRSGATPYCRKCHYNLTGVDRERDGARCPECGAATSGKCGVVVGARRRSWVKAWAGAILIPVGLTPHALVAYNAIPSWEKWFPTAMLIDYLDDSRPQVVDVSAAELQERYQAGLSEENIRRLAATCLRIQSDPNQPGFSAALELLGLLHTGDHLTEPERARYYEQIPELKLLVRERIPVDKPLIVQLSSTLRMLPAPNDANSLTMRISWPSPLVNGVSIESRTRRITHSGGGSGITSISRQMRDTLILDSPGSYHIATQVQVDVFDSRISYEDTTTVPLYSFTKDFSVGVEVVAPGTDVIELVRDPTLSDAMRDSITFDDSTLSGGRHHVELEVSARRLPVALAASVYIQTENRLEYVGGAVIPAAWPTRYRTTVVNDYRRELPAPPWTIVLRPDLDLAYRDPTLDAIWGEEIRIENVTPVEYPASQSD